MGNPSDWEPTAELRTNTVTYRESRKTWLDFFWPVSPLRRTLLQQRFRRNTGIDFEYEWRSIPHVNTERSI